MGTVHCPLMQKQVSPWFREPGEDSNPEANSLLLHCQFSLGWRNTLNPATWSHIGTGWQKVWHRSKWPCVLPFLILCALSLCIWHITQAWSLWEHGHVHPQLPSSCVFPQVSLNFPKSSAMIHWTLVYSRHFANHSGCNMRKVCRAYMFA